MDSFVHTQKPKSKKILKVIGIVFITLVMLAITAHFIWKYSGSGQWEFEREVDGVKVYSLKASGTGLKRFKMIGVFHSKLAGIMKVMRDPDTCDEVGCIESHLLDTTDYPHFIYFTFRFPMPFHFKPREYVVISEFRQDPKSKDIYVDFKAAPDKMPPNDGCCVRVTHFHDIWLYKPLEHGDVQVEFLLDIDLGGFVPYVLNNYIFYESIHLNVPELQAVLDKEEFQNAKVDYVQEVESENQQSLTDASKKAE